MHGKLSVLELYNFIIKINKDKINVNSFCAFMHMKKLAIF